MKKAFFAGIVALLALTMVTCDLFSPEGDKADIVYDANGNPWGVNLKFGDDSIDSIGRALIKTNALTYTNYYEVAFMYDGKVYRTSWRKGQTGRIAVPFGDYFSVAPAAGASPVPTGNTGAAILFAGTYANRDLLAVGKLAKINETAVTTTAVIDSATTKVTFALDALENEIKTAAGSTFTVTTTGFTGTPADVIVKIDNVESKIPLFPVKPGTAGTPATNTATWTITCPNSAGVIIKEAGTLDTVGILTDAPIPGLLIDNTGITPASGAVPSPAAFTLSFDVPDGDGLGWLAIDIPVCALVIAPDTSPGIWHIRGGLKNYEFDQGENFGYPNAFNPTVGNNSLGGGLLIGTKVFTGIIEIYTSGPTP